MIGSRTAVLGTALLARNRCLLRRRADKTAKRAQPQWQPPSGSGADVGLKLFNSLTRKKVGFTCVVLFQRND